MQFAPYAALAPSLRSVLSLALMPLGLLLACALVAGLGASVLFLSRAARIASAPARILAPPVAPPSRDATVDSGAGHSVPRAGLDFVERRTGTAASAAQTRLDNAVASLPRDQASSPEPPAAVHGAVPQAVAFSSSVRRDSAPVSPRPSQNGKRPGGPFQPGGRFSRSQQAFLRIPVVLSGSAQSGSDFREETCTLILLPQGAVLPVAQPVKAGVALSLTLADREPVPCSVFGAQIGPDGRSLVEIEFCEPQKNFWPVSFPAWAGDVPSGLERKSGALSRLPAVTGVPAVAGPPAAAGTPRTAVLNETSS